MIFGTIAFIILIICLLTFALIGTAITWHLLKYGIRGDYSKAMAIVFSIVALIMFTATIAAYYNVDWNKIDALL